MNIHCIDQMVEMLITCVSRGLHIKGDLKYLGKIKPGANKTVMQTDCLLSPFTMVNSLWAFQNRTCANILGHEKLQLFRYCVMGTFKNMLNILFIWNVYSCFHVDAWAIMSFDYESCYILARLETIYHNEKADPESLQLNCWSLEHNGIKCFALGHRKLPLVLNQGLQFQGPLA